MLMTGSQHAPGALCGVSQFVSGATFLVDGGILSRLHDPL
jgi:hypothetical protein